MNLRKFNIRWPLVSRKKLEAATRRAESAESRCGDRDTELRELREELAPKVKDIAERIVKTEWKRHRAPSRRICLVLEFDENMIHDALIWGNNATEVEFISRFIGERAAREIRQANFARYVDEPERRGYRIPAPE